MNKDTQKRISKIFVLTDLLIQELDTPLSTPTKKTKALIDEGQRFKDILMPILDNFYDNKEVSKTTFFTTLQKKFNYIFDKEYK